VRLHDFLPAVDVLELTGDTRVEISELVHDSRRVEPDALFCCIPGAVTDGHDHAPDAVARGASALLVERHLPLDVTQVRVERGAPRARSARSALPRRPVARTLRVLGVTGTNGKTTTTYLLEAIATAAGERAGVLGTTGARLAGVDEKLAFTTPEATELQALLATHARRGHRHGRDGGELARARRTSAWTAPRSRPSASRTSRRTISTSTAASTRTSRRRRGLFSLAFSTRAAVGIDDSWGSALATRADDAGLDVLTFGLDPRAAVRGSVGALDADGSTVQIESEAGTRRCGSRLPGLFNVQNALAAAALALSGGFRFDAVVQGLAADVVVPGRMEPVAAGQPFTVLVDYAHTPGALERLVEESRRIAAGRRVVLVFGCGGDRDPSKRAAMGEAAAGADEVVLTSDNPRSEDPAAIAGCGRGRPPVP
jgi:UDP-N-acetylmuramoyl-L-alanyl-D-glutamate--2,6-diaminopimelate ligase